MAKFTRTYDLAALDRFKKGITSNYGKFNDPTYLGFVLMFDDFDANESPLLVRNPDIPGSALNYLKNIGEDLRYNYLVAFQKLLFDTNYWMPWYWQSLSGIEKVMNYGSFKDPYRGGDDAILTIETLESIDLRVTYLIDLYRRIAFDYENRREILPSNLRVFRMMVFVQEIRNIQANFGTIGNALNTINAAGSALEAGRLNLPFQTPLQKAAAETASRTNDFGANLMFCLRFCEFEPDQSTEVFSSISNSQPEQMVQKLVISYENINNLRINDLALNSNKYTFGHYFPDLNDLPDPDVSEGQSITKKIEELKKDDGLKNVMTGLDKTIAQAAETAALNAVDTLAAEAVNAGSGVLNRFLLGNVYGFSPSNILTSLQQGSLLSLGPQVQNIINSIQSPPEQGELGNVYG